MFKASNSKHEVKQEAEFNSIAILKELKLFFANNKHQNLEPQDCERYNRILEAHNAVLVYDEEESVHRLWVNDEPLESEGAIQMLSAIIESLELLNAQNTSKTPNATSFTASPVNTCVQEQTKSNDLKVIRDKIKIKGGIVAEGPVHIGGVHTIINNPIYINHVAGSGVHTTINNPVSSVLDEADLDSKAAQLAVQLKANYSTSEYTTIQGTFGPPLKVEGQYINLQILCTDVKTIKAEEDKESKESAEAKPKEKYKDPRMASVEDLFGDKRVIKAEDLFKPARELFNNQVLQTKDTNEVPRLLLVQGRAGIGKTTFVRYVAHQWSKGQLYTNYTWVFTLTLRKLRLLPETPELSLSEWIRLSQFNGWEQKEFDELWKHRIEAATHQNKVLLILDGYDETPERHPCQSILKNLLAGGDRYANLSLLITTRPCGDITEKRRNLEIIGFTDENINQYIQAYFSQAPNKILVDILMETLRKQSVIWANAHIPLNLNLLCGIMEDAIKNTNVESLIQGLAPLSSMTCMYQVMENKLYEWSYVKQDKVSPNALKQQIRAARDFTKHYEKERLFLAELAFKSFELERIIIPLQAIGAALQPYGDTEADQEAFFNKKVCELGLIKPVLDASGLLETKQDYEFLHLTFQEYYTAIYLVEGLSSEKPKIKAAAEKVVLTEKYNPRWQIVWWFVAGLLRKNIPAYKSYLQQLQGQSAIQKDILEHYPLGLLARCIDEGFEPQNQQVIEPFVKQLQSGFLKLYQTAKSVTNNNEYALSKLSLVNSPFFSACWISPNLCMSGKQDLYALISKPKQSDDKCFLSAWIGAIRVITPKTLDTLLGLLSDKERSVRRSAALALGKLGTAAATPKILDTLLGQLVDEESGVRSSAADAVSYLGAAAATPKILDALLGLLADKYEWVRYSAADAVGNLGEVAATPKILDALLGQLADKNSTVRSSAAEAVGNLGEVAATPKILDALLGLLKYKDGYGRNFAASVLGKLGTAAATPKILDILLRLLAGGNSDVCSSAAKAVGKLGAVAATPKILDVLLGLMSHKERDVRCSVAEALGNLGEAAATPKILGTLLELLADENEWWVRRSAAEALGNLGEAAATPQILDALLGLLVHWERGVRCSAAEALGNLGEVAATPKILDALLELLADKECLVRCDAAKALGNLGTPAATLKILDTLLGLLADKESLVRRSAASALGNLGEAAATPKILDMLLRLLADKESYVRDSATEALDKLSNAAVPAVFLDWLLEISSTANNNKTLHCFEIRTETVFTLMPSFWAGHANHPNILAFVSYTLAAAYLHSHISCQIDFDEEGMSAGYCVRGSSGKLRYCFLITEEQAQSLAYLSSLIIEQLTETGKLDITNLKIHLLKRRTISLAQNLLGKKESGNVGNLGGSASAQRDFLMLPQYQQGFGGASQASANQSYREVKNTCKIS